MGAGRAIVSTPYAYASELLADGRGVLVPPASPVALAAALNELLGDPALRAAIGSRAYAHSRRMVWSAVGNEYARSVQSSGRGDPHERATRRSWPPSVPDLAPLHPISRQHLDVMTDGVGIMQHAVGSRPDPAHGYCVDDVARALQVDLLHGRVLGWAAVAQTAGRAMRFLADAFDPGSGRLLNFRAIDGSWIGGVGSDDSYGRAVLALGDVIAAAPDPQLVNAATALLDRILPAARDLRSPRAEAYVVLACAAIHDSAPGGLPGAMLTLLATRLHDRFRRRSAPDWPWPEVSVTYENALLPRALIVAGRVLDSEQMVATGLRSLDWLIDAQTSPDGHLSPVGNEWWPRGGDRSQFDQQPIEATALLLAAEAAHGVTGGAALRGRDGALVRVVPRCQ